MLAPTDEPFVTLVENHLAAAAVERLSGSDDGTPPPPNATNTDITAALRQVYLYGPAGVGKSHLVRQFLWNEQRRPDPPRLLHRTAAALVAELDEARAGGTTAQLWAGYVGTLDVLLLEDLAALQRKPESVRLVVAMLDEVLAAGGVALLTCHKSPGELDGVSARLVSRLHGGACLSIAQPGIASRVALLSTFARVRSLTIPGDVLQRLAEALPVNPRELRSAIARLDLLARGEGGSFVNLSLAERYLAEVVRPPAPELPQIAKAVAKEFGLTLTALRTGSRTAATALPRQIAMSLGRELTGLPLERIAAYFGRQNHGTVIHARKRLASRIEDDPLVRRHVAGVRRRLAAER